MEKIYWGIPFDSYTFDHGWKNCNGQIYVDWGDELFPTEIQEILEDLPELSEDSENEDSDICLDEPDICSDDDSDVEWLEVIKNETHV